MEQSAMNDLPQHVHDERNGLDYTLHGGDYPKNCVNLQAGVE